MLNTLVLPTHTVNVSNKDRPFSNNFVQTKFLETMQSSNGLNAHKVWVTCTDDSLEPGRMYCCYYTDKGEMISCYTIN